jgi:hypothetical protein
LHLVILSVAGSIPVHAQGMTIQEYERQSQELAKKQQKMNRKAGKKQRRMLRKAGKKQRKGRNIRNRNEDPPARRNVTRSNSNRSATVGRDVQA